MAELLQAAVENNLLWCDLMLRVHGVETHTGPDFWSARGKAPPFYPNLIVRKEDPDRALLAEELATLDRLCAQSYSVKDSYANLDLSGSMEPLFTSTWVAYDRGDPGAEPPLFEWFTVKRGDNLHLWTSAWADASGEPRELAESLFHSKLLEFAEVVFVGARIGTSLEAGAILFKGAGVVGVSNVFARNPDDFSLWRGVTQMRRFFPSEVLVGYEGSALAAALAAGFRGLGELRVWIKSGASAP